MWDSGEWTRPYLVSVATCRCVRAGTGRCFIIGKTKIWSKYEPLWAAEVQWHPFLVFTSDAASVHSGSLSQEKQRPPRSDLSMHNKFMKDEKPISWLIELNNNNPGKIQLKEKRWRDWLDMCRPVNMRNGGNRITRQHGALHHLCIWWSRSGEEPLSGGGCCHQPSPYQHCLPHAPLISFTKRTEVFSFLFADCQTLSICTQFSNEEM